MVILQARIVEWVPFLSPGSLPEPGIELRSPTLQAEALTSESPGQTAKTRGFSRVAAAFSSYDGDLSLPLG